MIASGWRDGFLFVGNQLSLDFLNTRPVIGGHPLELLTDSAALLRWLAAVGLLTRRQARETGRAWPAEAGGELEKLLEFRETYRGVVIDVEAGRDPPPAFISRVNELLLKHPSADRIIRSGPRLERQRRFDPRSPEDAMAPVLDAVANLLTIPDRSKIRKCSNCVLHFLDTSKKGTRRWCSMKICGNRFKVAAYGSRKSQTKARSM